MVDLRSDFLKSRYVAFRASTSLMPHTNVFTSLLAFHRYRHHFIPTTTWCRMVLMHLCMDFTHWYMRCHVFSKLLPEALLLIFLFPVLCLSCWSECFITAIFIFHVFLFSVYFAAPFVICCLLVLWVTISLTYTILILWWRLL
jgi:hypothetical protein